MVLIKDNSTKKYIEVQKGIKGKIFPIIMIQQVYFAEELHRLAELNSMSSALEGEIEELWEELENDTKSALSKGDDDENTKMDIKKISDEVKRILANFTTPEIDILNEYLEIKKKNDKLTFIAQHGEIAWGDMKQNKDNTYSGTAVKSYIDSRKLKHEFDTDTEDGKIIIIKKKTDEKSKANKEAKALADELETKAVNKLASLSDEEVDSLLTMKWIDPVIQHIDSDVEQVVIKLINALQELKNKYDEPLPEIDTQITELEKSLNEMLGELCGNEKDMAAIELFRKELFS